MSVRNMTEGRPARLILGVALPLMLGNIFQQMYTVVDAQIVGSVIGVGALAAVGAADWFNWLFIGLLQGFAQGFVIPIAQAFGANDHPRLRKYAGNALFLSAVTAALTTLAALLLIQPVLGLMNTPEAIRPTSNTYLTILFAGLPVVMGYNLLAGVLRSLGDGKSPLYAMIVASIVNIMLDLLFVAAFGWGVSGAALATVLAQACSLLFCLYRLANISFIRPSRQDLRPDRAVCKQLFLLGLPISFQNAIIGVGGMIVQSVANPLGVTFIAGYTATNKLYGLLEIAAVSYGYAISTYAGQNLGANKHERIRKGVHTAIIMGVLTAMAITVFVFLFGRPIIGSFISGTPEEVDAALKIGWEFLRLMSLSLPILYVLHIYRSAQTGMGQTFMPMLSGVAEFVMRTGSALILPALIGYSGIFWAEVLAWLGADCFLIPGYYWALRMARGSASCTSARGA